MMASTQTAAENRISNIKMPLLHDAVLSAVFAGTIIIYARLDSLLGADIRTTAFLMLAALSAFGAARCLTNGNIGAATISIAALLYVVFNMYVFSATFSTAVNFNVVFAFVPLTCTALFKWIVDKAGTDNVLRKLYSFAIGYAIIYFALSIILQASPNSLSQSAREALVLGDGAGFRANARADRILGYLALLTFGWLFTLGRLKEKRSLQNILIAALFLICIALTNSRTFILCIVLVTSMSLVLRNAKSVFSICISVLIAVSAFYIYCVVISYNPFTLFEYDGSGAARLRSFDSAAYWILRQPWFGVGTAPSGEIEAYYVVGQAFSLTDLGPAGIVYGSGLVGLALWIGLPLLRHIRNHNKSVANNALYLTLATMVLYQVIAPVLWYGGGTMLFSLWLATTLRPKPENRPDPKP